MDREKQGRNVCSTPLRSVIAAVVTVTACGSPCVSTYLVPRYVPYKIHTVLTDKSIQFTFPSRYANGSTAQYMTHMFDMRCQKNGIEYRLTKIKRPRTNGQAERMNRTIKEATVKRYHYDDHAQLMAHLHDFINACNFARRRKTLKRLTPYEYICKMYTNESEQFNLNPIHQMPGLHTCYITIA